LAVEISPEGRTKLKGALTSDEASHQEIARAWRKVSPLGMVTQPKFACGFQFTEIFKLKFDTRIKEIFVSCGLSDGSRSWLPHCG
jgi:hypothetical protein